MSCGEGGWLCVEMPLQAILGADWSPALRRGVVFHGKPELVELG